MRLKKTARYYYISSILVYIDILLTAAAVLRRLYFLTMSVRIMYRAESTSKINNFCGPRKTSLHEMPGVKKYI